MNTEDRPVVFLYYYEKACTTASKVANFAILTGTALKKEKKRKKSKYFEKDSDYSFISEC